MKRGSDCLSPMAQLLAGDYLIGRSRGGQDNGLVQACLVQAGDEVVGRPGAYGVDAVVVFQLGYHFASDLGMECMSVNVESPWAESAR